MKNKKEKLPKELEFDESKFDFETKEYRKGMKVFEEGTKPAGLFYVKKGRLLISRNDKEGNEVILREVKEGQFSGYNDLINNREYTKSAKALEDSILYFIAKKDFLELMNSKNVTMYFFRLTSIELNNCENSIINGASEGSVEVKDRQLNSKETVLQITMPELVNLLGLTAESFIKILSDLNNNNVISLKSKMITMPAVNRTEILKHLQNQLVMHL